jgi:hypothetical protein
MATPNLPPPDDDAEVDEEAIDESRLDPRELDSDAFRTVDGAYSDEPLDPAMIPVIEAGGGVAEGFEQSEALLVDHAAEGDDDGTDRVLDDAFASESEPDPGVYGESDRERTSEEEDEEEG